jgi:type I restriction enzyme M protein
MSIDIFAGRGTASYPTAMNTMTSPTTPSQPLTKPKPGRRKAVPDSAQVPLLRADVSAALPEVFKKLYYFLYSNSEASRAERIIEELSLVLLTKLACEAPSATSAWRRFMGGNGTAAETIWPMTTVAYPGLVDPHRPFGLPDDLLRRIFEQIEGIRLSDAPAHVLGEAFQALMGPRLRGDRGQFFTPRSVVDAMVAIVNPLPTERMVDPACGTGGFVAASALAQRRAGTASPSGAVGVDKDQDLARLSGALLAIAAKEAAVVHNFNSLDLREWESHYGASEGIFDVVLTNPPFGAKIPIREEKILAAFDLGRQWVWDEESERWTRSAALRSAQDPQILFIELCVRLLRPGGRMGIVLPEGLFGNKGDAYIWDWLRTKGQISALLDCPRTTFQPGTDTKTNVLFFCKASGKAAVAAPVRVAIALHCGHDRRGRSVRADGTPYPNDYPGLARDFHAAAPRQWAPVKHLNPHYLVPRYYARDVEFSSGERALVAEAASATLGELVERGVVEIKKGHEPGSEAYGTGDIPFVRTSDISNFEISTDPTKAVSEEVYREFARQQRLKVGDLLMVVDGRYRIGTSAMLTENNVKCVVQSHLRVITVKDHDIVTPHELLFALNLPTVKLRLRNLVFVQSTLGTLGRRLLELQVPLLHGPGAWRERVDQFERHLRERDRLLAALRSFEGDEVDL